VGAALLGAKVAIVEKHLLGGDCLNVGCVPSKALIAAARAIQASREAAGLAVGAPGTAVDFSAAMERVRRIRAEISEHDSVQALRAFGVEVYLGEAKLVSPDLVEVGGQRLRFARAVVATGSRPTTLPVPGLAETGFLTNETVWALTSLPPRLVIVGGGPIGCELAQALRRLGSKVSMVSLDGRLIPGEDADAAAALAEQFRREGIETVLGAKIVRVERQASGKALLFAKEGQEGLLVADEIIVAVGRAPNVEGLGLERAGVETDERGVKVDDRLRTSNPRIYAAGDVCSAFKFTHAADAMARVVIQNALFFGRKKASALVIPWCTYTDPEIAQVGITAEEAARRPTEVMTFTVSLKEIDRFVLDGEGEGFVRAHCTRKGQILGATIVARRAGEMIGEVALAMTAGLPLQTFSRTIHPYPTQTEALKRLGDERERTRLTPRVRGLLRRFMRWRR
jgi:pyruvate/2-oxoglutarate dehydrogenase complex dihydrolipoamide dehydrogenase (E3) component